MHITDLDEYQGVTPEMIRDWLRKRGWSFHDGKHRYWKRGKDSFADSLVDGNRDDVAFVIHCEELAAGMSPQEALREINPRMREITDGAFRSHSFNGGWWIVEDANREPTVRRLILKWCSDTGQQRAKGWPCDEHGNKLRWPTDAEGNML